MIVLNLAHSLSDDAVQQLTDQFGELEFRVIRVQLDMAQSLTDQIREVANSVGFEPAEWQTKAYAIVLPGASVAAGILLAEVHGRSGHFPTVVHLNRGEDGVFRVGEVVNLDSVRSDARSLR